MEQKFKIHACYILAILISVIVILVTVKWSQIPNLAQLISFALTLSSLILSAVAITYALYSNSSLFQNIVTLNLASQDVSKTAKDISKAAHELTLKIEAIPLRLESVEGKVDQTNVLLKQYSVGQVQEIPDKKEREAAAEIVDLFISRVSLLGLLTLYACTLAFAKKKPFDFDKMPLVSEGLSSDYFWGFLIATIATGIVEATSTRGIWNITFLNSKLHPGVIAEIDTDSERFRKRIARAVESDSTMSAEAYQKYAREMKSLVEQYFQ